MSGSKKMTWGMIILIDSRINILFHPLPEGSGKMFLTFENLIHDLGVKHIQDESY